MNNEMQTVDVFVAGSEGVHTYRIPSLLPAPGGTLLAFCEARRESSADDAPKDLVLKRSEDCGGTWAGKQIVVHGEGKVGINNPCPLVEGNSVYLFCITLNEKGPRHHRHLMLRSDDDGATWGESVDLDDRFEGYDDTFVPGPGVSLRMRSGRWVVPGYIWDAGGESFCRMAYSDDQGETWRLGEAVDYPGSNECQAVELSDGSLMLNFRLQKRPAVGCRGVAISRDGGETWTDTSLARELRDPICQAGFIRCDLEEMGHGPDCLLFSNLDSPPSPTRDSAAVRRNLTLRASYDGGRTWPVSRVVHEGPAAYSCPAVLPDRTIGLLYECGASHRYETIRFARLGAEWLIGGGT